MPRSSMWFLSFRSFTKPCMHFSSVPLHNFYMPHPFPSWFDYPNNILWRVQIMKLGITQCPSVPCYLVQLRPKYLPRTIFSDTLSLYSSFIVRDQVSYPCKRQAKL
jgi:hypothetical protein